MRTIFNAKTQRGIGTILGFGFVSSGEHTRPRVLQSATAPTDSHLNSIFKSTRNEDVAGEGAEHYTGGACGPQIFL
jgi:hypothetical protein